LIVQGQKNRRIQAEMDALRAQINPHFISNSLNAIESLVNFGDTKAAAKYLVHFSRLSRQILNGSRASMISLAEELKTLKHFLALEQLRFRDKLTFDIQIIDDIPAEVIQVPAMILQPYAENAIWHGIKPKAEGGHVQVNIRKIDKMLVCIVEDNGIGREKSRAMRKASVLKHKSMGMQITEERLKNLGKIKGSHIEIIDLKNEGGEAEGTKVIIRFPYQIKKS
jgi:LytS/YehU family sensor histidine kinase